MLFFFLVTLLSSHMLLRCYEVDGQTHPRWVGFRREFLTYSIGGAAGMLIRSSGLGCHLTTAYIAWLQVLRGGRPPARCVGARAFLFVFSGRVRGAGMA